MEKQSGEEIRHRGGLSNLIQDEGPRVASEERKEWCARFTSVGELSREELERLWPLTQFPDAFS